VLVLTIYLLADLLRIRHLFYWLIPASCRPRAVVFGDEIFAKIGAYLIVCALVAIPVAAAVRLLLVELLLPWLDRQ